MDQKARVWKSTIDQTKESLLSTKKIDEKQFAEYFETSQLVELNDKVATVVVDNSFSKMIMTQPSFFPVLQNHLNTICETEFAINLLTKEEHDALNTTKEEEVKNEFEFKDNLITTFTFDTFVIGASNKVAAAAANKVAISPGEPETNPLFIYGNSGLGKTHLLNAIGNKILQYKPNAKIYYTTTNGYMNDYVDAINCGTLDEFNQKYNSLDLLLLDDIQFLEGKDKTSEVFFHLFNNLVNNNKQIVITSDRTPQDLTNLHQRLTSRFASGLQIGIDVPEFETSLAILKKKMSLQGIDEGLIEEDVLIYMATHYGKDIRELEGKLRRIMFDAVLYQTDQIDMKFALQNSFKDDVVKHPTESLTPQVIIKTVAKYYNLTTTQIVGKNRTATVALARSLAMYLIKKDIDLTYLQIGKLFGGKGHTTVLKACQKVEKKIEEEENYKIAITEIREKYQ